MEKTSILRTVSIAIILLLPIKKALPGGRENKEEKKLKKSNGN